ncbi:TonB-dependent receptor [Duganella sp. LX20W]|uniref:TonB-dependent receptor n=1 Tax=Rugamonas brunnea TaxID=2758569 RepID=A0A7W2EX64_9BURK|nr:TonB-dependent receptor [Rugamonas brunnea]MBA5640269.1 TonB-dependent receptor [Rugamonas brunnea]
MTFPVSRRAVATSIALAFATPSVFADTQNDIAGSAVFITAARAPQLAADILSDTLTIDSAQIAQSGAGSVIELLQRQRGIEVARNGGPGTSASVFIRGANGNQNIVLVDGVRIGSATTGAANWSAIPLTAIDHIEVVYGPLSTLYGADAIGGVIQIFTKQGQGAPSLAAAAGYGSDHTRTADAHVSGATDGEHSIRYALSAGKEKSDGFSSTVPGNYSYNPDKDGYDKESAAGQVSLRLAPGHEISALFMHSRLDAQYDSGPSSYDTRSLQKLENAAIYSRNQLLPGWTSLLQYAQARDESGNFTSDLPKDRAQLNTRQTDFTWQNDIAIGADVLQLLYDHRQESVSSTSVTSLNRDRSTNAYAASYNAKRGAQLFNASIRRDNSEYGDKTTGAAGYGYNFTRQLRASASVGTSFRAPTYNELYYPGYGLLTNKPELGRNAEAGLNYDDGNTTLAARYYHNRLTDLIVSVTPCPYNTVPKSSSCAYNVNHALLEGLTLEGARKLGDFELAATVDLQDPKDETTGKRLARRAQRHANLALDYVAGPLKGGVELTLSGARYDDAANKNRLGGYGLVNLYATWQITPDWSALLRWNNVADKQYTLARFYSTAGSTVFASLRYGYK